MTRNKTYEAQVAVFTDMAHVFTSSLSTLNENDDVTPITV